MYDSNVLITRDPIVRVQSGTWCRIVDADDLGLMGALSFDREISWLRRAHAQACVVSRAGSVLDTSSTYCDGGSFLDCIASAFPDAHAMAAEHDVGSGSLRVEVRVSVEDRPVLPLKPEAWDTASSPPRYRTVPPDWIAHGDVEAVRAWLAGDPLTRHEDTSAIRRIERAVVLDEAVAWCSAHGGREAAAALEAVVAAALSGLPESVAERSRARLAAELAETEDA